MICAVIFIILMLLSSCGADHPTDPPAPARHTWVNLAGNPIIWQGSPGDSEELRQEYEETMLCLQSNFTGNLLQGYPEVFYTAKPFDCGYGKGFYFIGCSDLVIGAVYVQSNTSIPARKIFRHELIHYATGLGNEAHDGPLFIACSPDLPH